MKKSIKHFWTYLSQSLWIAALLWSIVVIGSGFFLLMIFAFATMVPEELVGWDWWCVVLGKTFRLPNPGIGTWPALLLFITGICFLLPLAQRMSRSIARKQAKSGWYSRILRPRKDH